MELPFLIKSGSSIPGGIALSLSLTKNPLVGSRATDVSTQDLHMRARSVVNQEQQAPQMGAGVSVEQRISLVPCRWQKSPGGIKDSRHPPTDPTPLDLRAFLMGLPFLIKSGCSILDGIALSLSLTKIPWWDQEQQAPQMGAGASVEQRISLVPRR